MRIALFGGSFDPPHRGHLAIARAAAGAFALDEVLFAPAARQPLKSGSEASFNDRLAMTALACAEDPRFKPSAIDAPDPRDTPNYTVDTLYTLLESLPHTDVLYNLVGADSFATLAQWRNPPRLLELAEWIVVSRPGHALADPAGLVLTPQQRARIHLLDSVHEDVAATDLRDRLRQGDPCEDLLPERVSQYIHQHHLYLATSAT
jgi:nicotinate-nucleotide adenylyltransferase